jgi:hypothetical protein
MVGGHRLMMVVVVFILALPLPIVAADSRTPIADGRTIWSHLKGSDYRKTFMLWPETREFAKGRSLHGSLISIYVNRTALDGINGKQGSMPLGSLIVMENYNEGKVLQNIVVMFKARSYNPSGGNWFWAKYAPDGTIETEGRVSPCIGCHTDKKGNDYLFTAPLR